MRVAAMADIHCTAASSGRLTGLFSQAAASSDVLLLCGDLTDYGRPEEASVLAGELRIPMRTTRVLGVLGNHDHESGQAPAVARILSEAGVTMLDGTTCEVRGIGFTGVKGFLGGFEPHALGAWGEESIKSLVREVKAEAWKLEKGLAALKGARRIVLLHYSPIRTTVEGESGEVFPFLGSSHLERALDRHDVTAVFHGHAHKGRLEGRTRGNIPVYNVAMGVLRQHLPDGPHFRIIEVDGPEAAE